MQNVTTTFESIASQLEKEQLAPAALISEPHAFIPELAAHDREEQNIVMFGLIVQARDECARQYKVLNRENPGRSRAELNATEPLPTLNAIRKALVLARRPILHDIKTAGQTKAERARRLAHLRTLASFDN